MQRHVLRALARPRLHGQRFRQLPLLRQHYAWDAPFAADQVVGGIYYPEGLISPNEYDGWDFDSTTSLARVPDVTANVQAAIDKAAAHRGGFVQLPPGVLRINNLQIRTGGMWLRGAGWEEFPSGYGTNSPAIRGKRGTYILRDSTSLPAISVANTANFFNISDIAFIEPQMPEKPSWAPTTFASCIQLLGGASNAGSFLAERLLFWGVYQAMQLGDASHTLGRITLRDIEYAAFSTGIQIYNCDDLIIDNVNHYSSLLQGSPNMQSYMTANTTAMQIATVNRARIGNLFKTGCLIGINLNGSYASRVPGRIKIDRVHIDSGGFGIAEAGSNVTMLITDYSMNGQGLCQDVLHLAGANTIADVVNIVATNSFNRMVVVVNAGGGGIDCRIRGACWFDKWSLAAAGTLAALLADATCTIYYPSTLRLTNAGGAPTTGGAGTFAFS